MRERLQTIYVCSKCDAQFPKWLGQCPECGEWGSLAAQTVSKIKSAKGKLEIEPSRPIEFDRISAEEFLRIKTGIEELDRVLGGGIVPGSLVLLGGEPGIGKSTLVLQIAASLAQKSYDKQSAIGNKPVLYISGEESAEQIKMRLDRLGINFKNLRFLGETDIGIILATLEKEKPSLAIIDSIQTMSCPEVPSEAGSVNQVRVSTVKLLELAKKNHLPIFIIGHVTKEGMVAGPKTLEHLVDTVLYLEGDPYHHFRLLRAVKNRFGATNEVGVFDLQSKGLVEIKNPSQFFLSERGENLAGTAVGVIIEGTRSFLVEVQALVNKTVFGYPQRRAIGLDFNRFQLLVAVLSRRLGLHLGNFDIHLNLVGGIKCSEPALDLAVALSIISAYYNKPIDPKIVCFGEVGLGGEIRSVSETEKRIKEAEKLGFEKIIIPKTSSINFKTKSQILRVRNLAEAIKNLSL